MAKRHIFGELMEGVAAVKNYRRGKLTLRSYKIESGPLPKVDSKLIKDTRKEITLLKSGVCTQAAHQRKNS